MREFLVLMGDEGIELPSNSKAVYGTSLRLSSLPAPYQKFGITVGTLGIEPRTSSLSVTRSTTELCAQLKVKLVYSRM